MNGVANPAISPDVAAIERPTDQTIVLRPGLPNDQVRLYRTVRGQAFVEFGNQKVSLGYFEAYCAARDEIDALAAMYFRSWLAIHDWSLDRDNEQ